MTISKHCDEALSQSTCGRWFLQTENPPQKTSVRFIIARFANLDILMRFRSWATAAGILHFVNHNYQTFRHYYVAFRHQFGAPKVLRPGSGVSPRYATRCALMPMPHTCACKWLQYVHHSELRHWRFRRIDHNGS